MDTNSHTLKTLFAQLGLPTDDTDMQEFIDQHHPLDKSVELAQASWWNNAQRSFLQEAINSDSDWAITVDALDTLLRQD